MAESIDDNQEIIIKEAVQHFVDAQLQGQELDINEFVKKYSGLENQIKQSIQDMQKIDALFDSLVQADESDFEEAAAGQELVGRKVGSFEIVEMIGRGGMGVVYLARDTKLKRSVALKFLPPELTRDPEAKERFVHEAQAASALEHNNICTIHEIDEVEGQAFIAMACVDERPGLCDGHVDGFPPQLWSESGNEAVRAERVAAVLDF